MFDFLKKKPEQQTFTKDQVRDEVSKAFIEGLHAERRTIANFCRTQIRIGTMQKKDTRTADEILDYIEKRQQTYETEIW